MSDIKGIVRQGISDKFPNKITIIKTSTKEEVVMSFDKGRMCQFLYKVADSHIKMAYDKTQKRYVALPNPPKIRMAYALVDNEFRPIGPFKNKPCPHQNLFTFFSSPLWGYNIWFAGGNIRLNMDFNHCIHPSFHEAGMGRQYLDHSATVPVVHVSDAKQEADAKNCMLQICSSTEKNPMFLYNSAHSR